MVKMIRSLHDIITEEDVWDRYPCIEVCKKVGMKHPCLECWNDAGDIVTGLRLEEINES